ncbi:Putative hydroxypyruvate isomerase YgbM [Aquimixticola soesokkakensis]|uniref:Putative hydroxypyruvate isomerase YgbM n=1 Tax=Aquimixticola soesokkakensis TaxID=1519096 RepID=A0A1Y5SZR5_9RHOB|nr:TIM barrel protein [Aquimixticola soesokkakensis]SLN52370.1 Putative hydroxypyruvate isomerase YgbM [Aquimixticola soesokkakensis]
MKIAANLSFLFRELPFIERFADAKAAGFDAVEVLFPYAQNAADIARQLHDLSLEMVMLNSPPPNYAGGMRGFAALPEAEARFAQDIRRVLRYARVLGAHHIHIMAGNARGAQARDCFVRNLVLACASAPQQSFVIEPVTPIEQPDYFLDSLDLAADIIAEVAAPNLGLLFDTYHIHHLTGDVPAAWTKHSAIIRHVQIASAARSEPDTGAFDAAGFCAMVASSGYTGWISAEYTPRTRTIDGLSWLKARG